MDLVWFIIVLMVAIALAGGISLWWVEKYDPLYNEERDQHLNEGHPGIDKLEPRYDGDQDE